MVLVIALLFTPIVSAQNTKVWKVEVARVFEEAQRFHLGIERPTSIERAIDLYKQLLKLDPNHSDTYYNLAGIRFEQSRYDLAIKYYKQVIRLQPDDGHSYNNLGTVYGRQGKAALARRLYLKAIQSDSTVAMAYYNLARFHSLDGEMEKAMSLIEKAIKIEPDNSIFVKQHARLEEELGKLSNTTVGLVVGALASVIILYSVLTKVKGV
jgi:tetratricopeptide (TPR) repeat protein